MAVAYVLEQNTTVRLEGERLIVERKKQVLHALHIFKLSQIIVVGNVSLTPPVVFRLLRDGIDTVFMSRNGKYLGRLQPLMSKNITLRCEQFDRLRDEEFSLKMARSFVEGKLANMRATLMRINRNRENARLGKEIGKIKKISNRVSKADNLNSLRGFEGQGSAVYFEGFSRGFITEEITFKKRVRRPPTDPVNALLSLGYTFLLNNVMSAVCLVGFDPYLGSLHAVEYGRPSLVLDLMEEWRPIVVDSLVLSAINLKAITLEDFKIRPCDEEEINCYRQNNDQPDEPADTSSTLPVRLTDDGFRKFVVQFERKMNQKIKHEATGQQLSYRDCIREQVRHFARVIRGEEKDYKPMVLR